MLKNEVVVREDDVVVSKETEALIRKAIRTKRPTLRGARLTDDARDYAAEAKTIENAGTWSSQQRAKGYRNLLRLADKLDGVGPYLQDGPVPLDKFNIGSWAKHYQSALPTIEEIVKVRDFSFAKMPLRKGMVSLKEMLAFMRTNPVYREEKQVRHIVTDETVQKAISDLLTNTNVCGTTGCACGWAAIDDYFIRQGLSFDESGDLNSEVIGEIFGINSSRLSYFFMPESYRGSGTPQEVSVRIRHFLGSKYFDDVRPVA